MNYKCILAVVAMGLAVSGCGIIPLWVSIVHTVGDAALTMETGKSSGEHALSLLTGEDCQFIRIIDGVSICMSQEEYSEYLISLNCNVYTWDILNRIFCKEDEEGT